MTSRANHTFDSSNTRYNLARMLAALETPMTYVELETLLHMSHRSVHFYVNYLRTNPRRVRVSGFKLVNSRWHKVIALGDAPDAKQPKKQCEKKRNAIRRAKVKADPELRLKQQMHEKARWARKKAVRKPTTWLSALTGA